MWLLFVLPFLVPLAASACSLECWFTCSPCISHYTQLWVSSSIPSVSAGHCGLSLTQRRLRVMNNATGRLFLKASHKASASSGILLEHEKQWSCAGAYQRWRGWGRRDGGWDWRREGFFWDSSASGEGNVLWSKGRNVKAVMWVNGSYFGGPGNVRDERWHEGEGVWSHGGAAGSSDTLMHWVCLGSAMVGPSMPIACLTPRRGGFLKDYRGDENTSTNIQTYRAENLIVVNFQ